MRITQSMLDQAIERLNEVSKIHIVSNDSYGYAQLAFRLPNSTGISNLSLGNTKAELYYQITFLLDWLSAESKKSNWQKNCTHFDNFNGRSEIRDRGYLHKYIGKIICSSCNKIDFNENQYNENHKPMDINGKIHKKLGLLKN